jgi:hypothetical protein
MEGIMKYFNFIHLKKERNYFVAGLPGCFTVHFNNPKAKIKKEAVKEIVAAMVVNRLFNGDPDRLRGMQAIIPEIKNEEQLSFILSKNLVIRRRLLWQIFQCIKWDVRALWHSCLSRQKAQTE